MKTRIAVLVSGGGTNLQALIDAQNSGIITLLAFSIPEAIPMAMMTREITRPMTCQGPLPRVNRPSENIMETASPRVAASGAVAPKVPPMTFALPGPVQQVVTPPFRASSKASSRG